MIQDIKINRLDPNTFEYQTYTSTDENLIASSNLDTVFSSITDYIEYYIYDQNQTLIYPLDTLPLVKYDIREGDVLLNPSSDLQNVGFDVGLYNILYSFYRKRLSSSLSEKYFISEISSDRTEIRLDSNIIANELIISATNDFIDYRETADYFVDFYLNFGNNQTVIANNIKLETDENLDPTVLIKLYEPLPINFNLKDELWVVEMLSDSQAYEVDFPFEPEVERDFTYIQGPNYSLDIINQTATSEEQFSYSTLIESNVTSSINQIQSLLNKKEININIDYKNYNNFINFSSAKTRLENFYYKVELIESYTNELNTLSSQIISDTQFSQAYSSSTAQLTSRIDDIIKNFDGYEYFLYFNSGSQYSYPKQNTTPPFQLYPANSVEAKTWLGSATPGALYYGGQSLSASNYDQNNRDWLYWSIPEYLREDSANQKYELFVDMVGQYYDNVWVYTKDLTNRFNADNRLDYGISKDLVADAIRDFAIKLYSNNFNTDDLFTAFLGLTPSGSAFPFPNITGSLPTPTGYEYVDTKISSSNDIVPQDDVNKSIYKRIYHNIPYLLKTKGTIAGIRALITSYGIPDTILRISEFGGKDRNESQDYDLKQNVFNYAFDTGRDSNTFISSSLLANQTFWNPSGGIISENGLNTVQFRFKSHGIPPAVDNVASSDIREKQLLWVNDSNGNDFTQIGSAVVLEYNGAGFVTGSYSGSIPDPYDTWGTLKFYPDLGFSNQSVDIYLPFFNKDWWSVQMNFTGSGTFTSGTSTVTASLFAANKINGKIGFSGSGQLLGVDGRSWTKADFGALNLDSNRTIDSNVYEPFSGSFQEYRMYCQAVSESRFFDYTVNPYSNEGNGINSTPDQQFFRAALGSQLSKDRTILALPTNIAPTSIHPRVTGSATQITQSFDDGTSDYFISLPFYKGEELYVENKEFIYQDQLPAGIKNRITDKVHKQNLVLAEAPYGISASSAVISSENNNTTTISSLKSIQTTSYVSQSYTPSINYLEVGFSPSNQINDDINAQIGYFNIGEYIGDPRFISSSAKSYPDLDRLRDAYFEKYMASYDVRDFIRLIKFFDNSLFKMIKDFTPARTSLSSGVIVKQHLLERNRQRQALASSSFHNYSGSIKPYPKDYNTGSDDQPQYSTSGSAIYKFTGGPGGVMNRYNGIKTSPSSSAYGLTNIFGPLTQSYEEVLSGPLGQETVTIFNQDEFYNGEFSGSDILVQDGNLNPGCDIYKDPSSKPITFKPIFYSNNTIQQGISTLDSFNNINNFPRQGFVWFYSEVNQGSQIDSSMKYIKLATKDIDGNSIGDFIESTNTLDVVFTDISLPGGRTATEYYINNSINNGTHVLIEVDTSQGDFNITASAQGGSEQWMLETSGSFTSSFDATLSQANLRAQNSFIDNTAEFQRQYLWFWGDQDGTANIPKQPANLSFFNPGSSTKPAIGLLNDNNFISGSYTLGRTPNVPLYFSASLFYSSSRFNVGTVITKTNQLVHSGSYPFQSPTQNFALSPSTTLSGEFIPSPITVDVDPLFFSEMNGVGGAASIDQTLRGDQGSGTLSAGSSQIVQAGTATLDFHFPQITFLSGAQNSNPPKTFITPYSGSDHTIDGTTNQNFGGSQSTIAGVGYTDNSENGQVQWNWTNYISPVGGYNTLSWFFAEFEYTIHMPNPPISGYTFEEIGVQWFGDNGVDSTIVEISNPFVSSVGGINYTSIGGSGFTPPSVTFNSSLNTYTVTGELYWGDPDFPSITYPYTAQSLMTLLPYFRSQENDTIFPEYYIDNFNIEIQDIYLWNGQYNSVFVTPTSTFSSPTSIQVITNNSIPNPQQPLRDGTQGNLNSLSKLFPFSNRAALATGGNTITASVDLMYTSSTRDDIITSSLDVYHTLPADTSLSSTIQYFGDTITFPDSPILNINDTTIPDGTIDTSGSTVNEVDGMYYIRFNFDNLKIGTAPTLNTLYNEFDFDSLYYEDAGIPGPDPSSNTKILLDQDVQDASGGTDQITASFFIEKGNTNDTSTFGGDSNRFYLAQPFLQTEDTTTTGRINFDGQLPEFIPQGISTTLNVNDTLRFGIEVEKSFTFGLVVTSYSMSIFPSSSRWASYVGLPSYNDPNSNFDPPNATDVIIPSFYGEGILPFQYATDCQPLLNNYNLQRQSTFLMDVDYNTQSGPVIPVNQAQILSNSAIKAAVPDSNYSQLKSILPRYVGSKSTSQELNTWNVGDTGTFGKLPTIELKDAFFGYFNDIDDPYPNINGLTRINLNYLIDEQGNALPPSLEPLAIDTLKAVFPNTTVGKLAAKSGKTQYKELGEPAPIQRLMQYVTPVMYSQISAHNYVNEIPLSGSGYISQYDNGDENDVLFLRYNALGPASVDTSFPVQSVDYYLDPEDDITFSPLNDEDPYIAQSATNCKRVTSYAANTGISPNIVANQDLASSQIISLQTSFVTSFVSETKRTRDELLFELHMYTRGSTSGGGIYTGTIEKPFNLEDIQCKVYTNDGRVKNIGSVMDYGWFEIANIVNYYKVKRRQTFRSFFRRWRFKRWVYTRVPVPTGGIKCTVDWEMYETLYDLGLWRNSLYEITALEWTINANSGKYTIKGNDKISWRIRGSFKTAKSGYRQGLFFPLDFEGAYTSVNLQGQGANDYLMDETNNASSPFWVYTGSSGGRNVVLDESILVMSSSNMNEAYGTTFRQADLEYQPGESEYFPFGKEPSYTSFDRIDSTVELRENDEIRFANNENFTYRVIRVYPPQENIESDSGSSKKGRLKVQLDRPVDRSVNKDFFLVRRPIVNPNSLYLDTPFPYESLSSASLTTTVRNKNTSGIALSSSALIGPTGSDGGYTASMLNIETATTPGILYPDFPTQYLVESASIIVNDLISKGIIES
jgi:hypothetical protein